MCRLQAPLSPDLTLHLSNKTLKRGHQLSLLHREASRPVCCTALASHGEGRPLSPISWCTWCSSRAGTQFPASEGNAAPRDDTSECLAGTF